MKSGKKWIGIGTLLVLFSLFAFKVFFLSEQEDDSIQVVQELRQELLETQKPAQVKEEKPLLEAGPAEEKKIIVSSTPEREKITISESNEVSEPAFVKDLRRLGIKVKEYQKIESLSKAMNEHYKKQGYPRLEKEITKEIPENAVKGELLVKSIDWQDGGSYQVGYHKIKVEPGEELSAIDILENEPEVLAVEPNIIIKIQTLFTISTQELKDSEDYDPYYIYQWGLKQIEADKAWQIEKGNQEVKIAILDTGVDLEHPDLRDNLDLENSYDYLNEDAEPEEASQNSHGTHIAGIIAGVGGNGIGIQGVNWQAKLIIHKILGGEVTEVNADKIARAITEAIDKGARVINMSWGTETDMVEESQILKDAFESAFNSNVLLVAAAGSRGKVLYPAKYEEVLAVAGTDKENRRWISKENPEYESAYGEEIDISAPAEEIYSTIAREEIAPESSRFGPTLTPSTYTQDKYVLPDTPPVEGFTITWGKKVIYADDYPSITAAIQALPPEGGIVQLAPKTYVEKVWLSRSNMVLRGDPSGRTVIRLPDKSGLYERVINFYDKKNSFKEIHDVVIENITIDGNQDNQFWEGNYKETRFGRIYGEWQFGISITGSYQKNKNLVRPIYNVLVRNCRIINTMSDSVYIGGNTVHHVVVENNLLYNAGRRSTSLTNSHDVLIRNNLHITDSNNKGSYASRNGGGPGIEPEPIWGRDENPPGPPAYNILFENNLFSKIWHPAFDFTKDGPWKHGFRYSNGLIKDPYTIVARGNRLLSADEVATYLDKIARLDEISNSAKEKVKYGYLSGTSMSSAFVSGVAGLLLAYKPDLSKEELRALLKENVDEVETEEDKPIGGRLNAYKALQALSGGIIPSGGLKAVAYVGEEGKKSYSAEAGEEVKFFGDKSTAPEGIKLQYLWDFGDGKSSQDTNPVHSYRNEKRYQAELIVFTENGEIDSDKTVVIVGKGKDSSQPAAGLVTPPSPPIQYPLPQNAIYVSNTEELKEALRKPEPQDIILKDGVYTNSSYLQIWKTHRLWAEHLGKAILTFGLNFRHGSNGAEVHGLTFNVKDRKLGTEGASIYTNGGINIVVTDIYIYGNKIMNSGIMARTPEGLKVQRVVIQDVQAWGIYAQKWGVWGSPEKTQEVLDNPAVIEDVNVQGVTKPIPGSMNGTGEAGIWIGATAIVRRVKVRDCAWMGIWTGGASNESLLEDLDVDETSTGIYIEHWTRRTTFQKFYIGPNTRGIGINAEWAYGKGPEWAAAIDVMIRDGVIEAGKVGIHLSDAIGTKIYGVRFRKSSCAGIILNRAPTTEYGNLTFELPPGASTVKKGHVNSCKK